MKNISMDEHKLAFDFSSDPLAEKRGQYNTSSKREPLVARSMKVDKFEQIQAVNDLTKQFQGTRMSNLAMERVDRIDRQSKTQGSSRPPLQLNQDL